MALWRFHGQRFFSANYFSRNIIGFAALAYLADYLACYQYGVSRMRDPNILWPWWLEFQAKIRAGVVPENTPGYSVVSWRNAMEDRNMETLDVAAINADRTARLARHGFAPAAHSHDETSH